jgi:hypothetical protein
MLSKAVFAPPVLPIFLRLQIFKDMQKIEKNSGHIANYPTAQPFTFIHH